MYERVYASVDLDAIKYNIESMRKNVHPSTKMIGVIKTDGYGHGAVPIGKCMEELEYVFGFAVATVEEALILRRHDIKKPILILGHTFHNQYEEVVREELRPNIYKYEMARGYSEAAVKLGKTVKVHVKIDTAMNRLGMQVCQESAKTIAEIAKLPNVEIEGIFTHFAKADETDKGPANNQIALFERMIQLVEREGVDIPYKHCSNSAGIIDLPQANMNLVRAGVSIYGMWPSQEVNKSAVPLKPVMSLKSQIVYLKEVKKGSAVSYGGTYVLEQDEKIATIPVGYGDGYPRSLSNKGYVLVAGKRAPIRGRICMDQFMVDVSHIEEACEGMEVTLVGKDGAEEITMEEIGDLSGRFNYEFACDLGKRIPRVYYQGGKIVETKDYFGE